MVRDVTSQHSTHGVSKKPEHKLVFSHIEYILPSIYILRERVALSFEITCIINFLLNIFSDISINFRLIDHAKEKDVYINSFTMYL